MKYRPYKRVGEPSSFKGIKGPYLFSALYYSAGLTFSLIIIFTLPINNIIQLSIVVSIIIFWLYKMNSFKSKSKSGDIHKMNKDRCRKNIHIKSNM